MEIIDIKISRHDDPDLVKVEFIGAVDAVMISMRGIGSNRLTDDDAVQRALGVLAGVLNTKQNENSLPDGKAGTDQTLAQP